LPSLTKRNALNSESERVSAREIHSITIPEPFGGMKKRERGLGVEREYSVGLSASFLHEVYKKTYQSTHNCMGNELGGIFAWFKSYPMGIKHTTEA
jgi:hypothetical protein